MKSKYCTLISIFFLFATIGWAQEKKQDRAYKPLTLKLNEEGSKYVRFIIWNQFQLNTGDLSKDFSLTPQLRRSRILAFAQVSPRFLILTHFGLNSLKPSNLTRTGKEGNGPQLFMHGMWGEMRVINKILYIGGGLHYWGGMSRLTGSSTLNFLSMDNPNPLSWHSLGHSDQFARHLGAYFKGKIGKLDYKIAFNKTLLNNFDADKDITTTPTYQTARRYSKLDETKEKGNWLISGYVNYQFLDQESNKLPFLVGSYLGKKKVFNLGVGFFYHPDATIQAKPKSGIITALAELENNTTTNDAAHFAIDAFYDAPLGSGALTALLAYYNLNYGKNFNSRTFTGSMITLATGYVLPKFSNSFRLQPYFRYNHLAPEAFENAGYDMGIGANFLFNGHHSKLSIEYISKKAAYTGTEPKAVGTLNIQYHIFI